MRFLLAAIAFVVAAFPQTKGTTEQQAKECAQNFIGNNNTGTITCYNIDKKLADQIGQLVAASKRDGKTLKDISDKLAELLKELERQPTITVTSINQQGGITAGQVTINNSGPPPVTISFSEVSANQRQTVRGTEAYVSEIRVSLSGFVPVFQIEVAAPSLTRMDLIPEGGGATMGTRRPVSNGNGARGIQNALGPYILRLESSAPERFQVRYGCQGVACIGP